MPKFSVQARHAVDQPLDESYRFIPLTQDQLAIVDYSDYEHLSEFDWRALWNEHTNSFYAVRSIGRQAIYMHRQILGCGPKEQGDHENHDTLDNRRKNLRIATHNQNEWNKGLRKNNSSGYKGVSWSKHKRKWEAQIWFNGKGIYLGRFPTAEQAARAYDEAANKLHVEFAVLNFAHLEYPLP